MPQSVTLNLTPDPKQAAILHGKDYGEYLAKAPGGGSIDYEVTSSIAVHGHAIVNGKKELASLLVFKVKATAPRRRPIKELEVELVFKKTTAKTDLPFAPRILQILPGSQGYKVECKQGAAKWNRMRGGAVGISGGPDVAQVNADLHQDTEEELEQPVEFYTFARGWTRQSDIHVKNCPPNVGLLSCEGASPTKGSVPKGGVAPVIHLAVVLLRKDDGPFTCKVKVPRVEVDPAWAVKHAFASLWNSGYGPLTYDPAVNEQPDDPIDPEKLEEYLKEAKLKELVEIMMPADYDEWKYGKAPVEEDDE
ncbi:hypothetical protein K432DRAFT_384642 [Lepidopterella palustris CBS 459.81]|uniref:Uncharacterized protein n=1 Tax=Lepidopterella palustris CBS 459.81 TaxID=1314670 RepID=A0A8E2JCM1_9PEZI|nr:hypothetical protein K432DRAFT_384642 [Lepidopterella palustris CBS 459.81]